ncbi:recombination protein RecR [candidate division WWE3 bacterium CG_4_9_14_3_um_filter_34_6]|uniref:Recombination protein RecR n=1 Tax=candidate division WWE3 bacterium CG_4_9_14_3_um_filter_34_6 TaxID=1975079 RepID=A0A2M7X5N5_UNCKA|nr:MAG: recombination protein RecR [candidate division WWE3 bacterium CG_4_9_14_3_um_filter_34_6]
MTLPKSILNVIDGFSSLPGIGPKTAQRLAFYLLKMPKDDVLRFSKALADVKEKTQICKKCFNVGDSDLCEVCNDSGRDKSTICVVESPLDVLALEGSGYKGVYHVLHGVINPIAGIGPDEIFFEQLLNRLNDDEIHEIILANNTTLEGESTALYIHKEVRRKFGNKIRVSRIGKGLPLGADIEYADEGTLHDALSGRVMYKG